MKAMKIILLVIFFSSVVEKALSQPWILGDSLKVDFYGNNHKARIVNSESDLVFKILLTNISKRPIHAYNSLVFNKYSSKFGNYYWELYKKDDSGYKIIPRPIGSSEAGYVAGDLFIKYGNARRVDSALAVYDLPKTELSPYKTDTLQLDLLFNQPIFEAGDYGVQIFFRAGELFAIHGNMRESIGRSFVYSELYYFRVTKKLTNILGGAQVK